MLQVLKHPLITHKLTRLRKKETNTKTFREILDEIAGLMAYEITRDIPLDPVRIETPVGPCESGELSREIVLVPVLRAGLGMVDGIRSLVPSARVGHIGIYRDHDTLQPQIYYSKFPEHLEYAECMVLDPMLATGGSAAEAITAIKKKGAKNIRLVSIVGAPEGVDSIRKRHPDVRIYLAALDEKLNGQGYIVPGLGDAGDRLFGTK